MKTTITITLLILSSAVAFSQNVLTGHVRGLDDREIGRAHV